MTSTNDKNNNKRKMNDLMFSQPAVYLAPPSSYAFAPEHQLPPSAPPSASTLRSPEITSPGPADVICGTDKESQRHVGNVEYQKLVKQQRDLYQRSQTEKANITRGIIAQVHANGGRFLRWDNGTWQEINEQATYDKVQHALRHKGKGNKKSGAKKAASASAGSDAYPNDEEFEAVFQTQRQLFQQAVSKEMHRGDVILSQLKLSSDVALTVITPPADTMNLAVVMPESQDVLCGKGGRTNHHFGNIRFRRLVAQNSDLMEQIGARQGEAKLKTLLSQSVVDAIRCHRGRFLKKDGDLWIDIGSKEARAKTSQTFRDSASQQKREQAQSADSSSTSSSGNASEDDMDMSESPAFVTSVATFAPPASFQVPQPDVSMGDLSAMTSEKLKVSGSIDPQLVSLLQRYQQKDASMGTYSIGSTSSNFSDQEHDASRTLARLADMIPRAEQVSGQSDVPLEPPSIGLINFDADTSMGWQTSWAPSPPSRRKSGHQFSPMQTTDLKSHTLKNLAGQIQSVGSVRSDISSFGMGESIGLMPEETREARMDRLGIVAGNSDPNLAKDFNPLEDDEEE